MNYITHSEKETFERGVEFGKNAKAGEVYALNGSLGSGKSVFSRGFARGLGIEAPITSPTFTVMNMYEEGLPFITLTCTGLPTKAGIILSHPTESRESIMAAAIIMLSNP